MTAGWEEQRSIGLLPEGPPCPELVRDCLPLSHTLSVQRSDVTDRLPDIFQLAWQAKKSGSCSTIVVVSKPGEDMSCRGKIDPTTMITPGEVPSATFILSRTAEPSS